MAVCLSLSADVAAIQAWRPLYLVLTVIIVCSQKVDTTLSKGVLRIAASVLGGTYGVAHFFTLSIHLTCLACHVCFESIVIAHGRVPPPWSSTILSTAAFLLQPYWHLYGVDALYDVFISLHILYLVAL